jgi:uncharacterized protein YecT (DUF1311 family)
VFRPKQEIVMRNSLTVLIAISAFAAVTAHKTAQADECDNAQGSQAELNACYDKVHKKSDAELNKLYKEVEARLKDNADRKKLLVTAQRAWVAFRDAECGFQSSASAEGSVGPMIQSMCLDTQTKGRIEELKSYLKCEEGDLSCPVPPAN